VTSSSITGKNRLQLAADVQGNSLVAWYDRTSFLSKFFRPLAGITSFRASHDQPGIIYVREKIDAREKSFSLLREEYDMAQMGRTA
jgi:hypothetical protein